MADGAGARLGWVWYIEGPLLVLEDANKLYHILLSYRKINLSASLILCTHTPFFVGER